MRVRDEDDVVTDAAKVGAIKGTGSVDKIWVSKTSNIGGDLGTHAVLLDQGLVRISAKNESFKHGSIQVIAVALLYCERVVVDLGT